MMLAVFDPAHRRAGPLFRRGGAFQDGGRRGGSIAQRGLLHAHGRVIVPAPAFVVRAGIGAPGRRPAFEPHRDLGAGARGGHQVRMFFRHRAQGLGGAVHGFAQRQQRLVEFLGVGNGVEGGLAARHLVQGRTDQAQFARRGFQVAADVAPFGRFARIGQSRDFQRTAEVHQLVRGHAAAQEARGGVGQLVRFVEDHRVGFGQEIRDALFAQHQVGHEQRMVDDHHIGLLGLAARLDDEAVADARALLAQAVLAGGGHALPDVGVFGHLGQVAAVTRFGNAGEHLDLAQLLDLGAGLQRALVALQAFQVVVADVVAAALEQRGGHRRGQRGAHARQIAREELVLQGARAGGNQHLAALDEGGYKIGPGLADASARFGHQRGAVLDGLADGLRQLHLRRTRLVAGQGRGQRPVLVEEFGNIQVQHAGSLVSVNGEPVPDKRFGRQTLMWERTK
ncbi:hypothetical protein D3C85_765300 [compost metagenome]